MGKVSERLSLSCLLRILSNQVSSTDLIDRNMTISKPQKIEAWVGFDFPGRRGKHSRQMYNWHHFSGTDYNASTGKNAIYKFEGKKWAEDVAKELGNYDYLMFADLDYSNSEVRDDVKRWVEWIVRETGVAGLRLDAVKQ